MSSASMTSLPEECLLAIIHYVAADASSLHSLLLTDKRFFRLAAQVLYHNPFEYVELHLSSRPARRQRRTKILQLLLACPSAFPPVPSNNPQSPQEPTIDYLSLYSYHSEKLLHNINVVGVLPDTTTVAPLVQDGVTLMDPTTDASTGAATLAYSAASQARMLSAVRLHDSIHQILISHSPQHIRTLGFSIHGLSTLAPFVDQLSSLSRLELYKRSARVDLSGAEQFILAHRQRHTTLQELKIRKDAVSDRTDLSCLVLAMGQPRVLDLSGWMDADLYLDQFPLQDCRVLLMRLGTSATGSSFDPWILTKMIHLQVLRMPAFSPDMFSPSPAPAPAPTSIMSAGSFEVRPLSDPGPHPHTGLLSVSLQGRDEILIPALRGACSASCATLCELSSLSSFGGQTSFSLSWDWALPRLRRLDLEGTVAATFNLQSLSFCPVLEDLRLNVGRQIPPGWDIRLKASHLTCVAPTLRTLELSGWWDLPDNELTTTLLPVLRRLYRLNLMWCRGPSGAGVMQLMPELTSSLRWLGISSTQLERDQILSLKTTLGLAVVIDTQLVRR
ncbi:hypothetical protein BGZ75_003268 [Mortierella antarctica]|nr:hypothetical protein BGZ75_003268 [Mortierella antarctica]